MRRPGICFGSVVAAERAALARAARAAIDDGADVAEIRADLASDPAPEPLRAALPAGLPACYTLRSAAQGGGFAGSESRAIDLRERAAACRFDWVDVEAPAAGPLPPRPAGVRVVASFHDPAGVPADPATLYARLRGLHADVVKLVGTAREPGDAAPLLALLPGHGDLATWCMGEAGLPSRLLAWRAGAAACFGAADPGAPAAPGQPSVRALTRRYRIGALSDATGVYGVAGDPVAHSRGPALHNAVFAAAGIDAVYLPVQCADLGAAVGFLRGHGLAGLSVTRPHKGAAVQLPGARVDHLAAAAGSGNTVRVDREGLAVTSTDGLAAVRALEEALGAPVAGRRALVLGAGGAAAAAAHGLKEAGCDVTVCGRTDTRARRLAAALGVAVLPWDGRHASPSELVVHTTPLGMRPGDPLPIEPGRLARGVALCEAVYTPPETPLVQAAHAAGWRTASGVRWFLHQAHAQLEFWGIDVGFEDVERAWTTIERDA